MKQAVLGGRRIPSETLVETFPQYLDSDMDITTVNRENVLSSSYQVENTYFIKVVTPRHVRAHRFLTWWRNTVFKLSRLATPFQSYDKPIEMVQYEYEAMENTYNDGGAIAQPYAVSELPGDTNATALLFDYVPNAGKLKEDKKSLRAFEHIVHTVRILHDNGYTHTSLPFHVLQSVPDGKPYISDPIGRTHDTDHALLLGIGFDLATLLARYTPYVGALPALNVVGEHYSDVEIIAAYKTSVPIQVTVPETPGWAVRQLRQSIDEYADADAVDTYLEITNTNPADTFDAANAADEDTSEESVDEESESSITPFTTREFINAALRSSDKATDDHRERRTTSPGEELSPGVRDDDIYLGDFTTTPSEIYPAGAESPAPPEAKTIHEADEIELGDVPESNEHTDSEPTSDRPLPEDDHLTPNESEPTASNDDDAVGERGGVLSALSSVFKRGNTTDTESSETGLAHSDSDSQSNR